MTRLRVVLAEDHRVMREGLRMVVEREPNMEVVGEAGNGRAAVALAVRLRPEVVVMDISMPELNGLKATKELKEQVPDARVLVLTRHTDNSYVQEMLRSGASGYVLKQSASDELVRAIRRVAAGHRYLDPALNDQVLSGIAATGSPRSLGITLTRREEDVLRCVALGFLAREIAERLKISIKTVETHKANAMSKMGMKNRIDIVRYAVLQGWLEDT
jgi:two-component system, NarL family, response regulator NreC